MRRAEKSEAQIHCTHTVGRMVIRPVIVQATYCQAQHTTNVVGGSIASHPTSPGSTLGARRQPPDVYMSTHQLLNVKLLWLLRLVVHCLPGCASGGGKRQRCCFPSLLPLPMRPCARPRAPARAESSARSSSCRQTSLRINHVLCYSVYYSCS